MHQTDIVQKTISHPFHFKMPFWAFDILQKNDHMIISLVKICVWEY